MDQKFLEMVESASLNAWPAPCQMQYDGWLLRMTGGHSKRVNSVNVRRQSTLPLTEKIKTCEQLYARFGLPIYFRLTDPFTPLELRRALVLAGYEEFDPTFVMGRAIDNIEPYPAEMELREMDPVDWLELRAWMTGTPLVRLGHHAAVLKVILPEKVLLGLLVGGQPVACGMGVIEGRLLGYFSIYTRSSVRRRGYGKAMMSALSQWGKARGADYGYLQVEGHNAPALAMYARLGFERLYRYLYCKKG